MAVTQCLVKLAWASLLGGAHVREVGLCVYVCLWEGSDAREIPRPWLPDCVMVVCAWVARTVQQGI